MKKLLIILALLTPFTAYAAWEFKSLQLAPSPQNGYILSTDGTNSSWIANSGGGGGGSGNVATSTAETSGYFPTWSSTSATPATLAGTSQLFQSSLKIGVGSTTPWGGFSVHRNTSDTSNSPLFTVASSTASATTTAFNIGNNGVVGINTDVINTSSKLLVNGNAVIGGTSNTQGTTLYVNGSGWTNSGLTTNNSAVAAGAPLVVSNLISPATANISVSQTFNAQNQAFSSIPYASLTAHVIATSTGAEIGDFAINTRNLGTVAERLRITGAGNAGIGTTTPRWALTVSSSTGPQLSLTDGSLTSSPFNFRSTGNWLYLSTSSPTTFATSSTSVLSINGNSGVAPSLSVGTTTTAGILNLGPNPSTSNASSTIRMGKLQFEGTNSAGALHCTYLVGTAWVVQAGACNN
jgi:hypothetical protein